MRKVIALAALAFVALAGSGAAARAADEPYRLVNDIAIGGDGGWDYLSVDSAAHRLYVSHATTVVVVDLSSDTVVGEIADTPGVHGFALAPALGRGFASNGRENTASIVDLKTLKTIGKVNTGKNPDAILFEPAHGEVYTFNGASQDATVIDAAKGTVVTTIALGGKPEFPVDDVAAGRIYVNIEDRNTVAVIDTATHTVVATWPIAPGEEATGLAFDAKNKRLFIGCHNNRMLMMDAASGRVVGQVPIGAGVDATWFDPGTGYAFSSQGDGTVTVAHEDGPDRMSVVQTIKTERGGRTMALDAATHKLYVPVAKYEEPQPGAAPNARPKMRSGSMRLLVFALAGK